MDQLSRDLEEEDRKVQLPSHPEVKRIQLSIEKILNILFSEITKKDPRLDGALKPVGSYYSGLKILLPDEFDFLYELNTLVEGENFEVRPTGYRGENNLWRTPPGDPSRRKIFVKTGHLYTCDDEDSGETWLRLINDHHILDPVGVKNTLYYQLLSAVENFDENKLPKYLSFQKEEPPSFMYGPATTLYFLWNGRFYKNLKISVDITVGVKASSWRGKFDFLRKGFLKETSCLRKILEKSIKEHGYHLVPYISDRGHVQWKLSTSFLETQVFSTFPNNSNLKRVTRILKSTKEKYLKCCPSLDAMQAMETADCLRFIRHYDGVDYNEYRHLVSSYYIKNVVFHTCGWATATEWNTASLSTLYIMCLCLLYRSFPEDCLHNFFFSRQRLNKPQYGDILPGFHEMFKDLHLDNIHEGISPIENTDMRQLDVILNRTPFDRACLKTNFKLTKEHIQLTFEEISKMAG